jgi:hypothetical protein
MGLPRWRELWWLPLGQSLLDPGADLQDLGIRRGKLRGVTAQKIGFGALPRGWLGFLCQCPLRQTRKCQAVRGA